MTFLARTLALRGVLLLALVLAGLGIGAGRRAFIRQFFVDGAVADDAPVWPRAPIGAGVEPVVRVRVVLLDGLSRSHAAGLPHLSELCARGQELHVDVGFPTVSLPVQHVLWTGRTQQQSGLQYHVGGLREPPRAALPRQVDSVAVAESHPEIVHAFGFARALPTWSPDDAPTRDDLPAWRAHDFIPTAHAAVTSPARLAFIHVLRVDEAGHRSGAASLDYAAAAAWADSLLGVLHTAAPSDPGTLWLVLSDHGHRAGGGHGGAEPEIRIVRACLFGGAVAPGLPTLVHLVDLSRALADALTAELHPEARGRPLAAALQDPARGATMPRPGPLRWTVAGLILILASLSLRTGRSHHVPWTSRLALLSPPLGGPRWLPPALGAGWLLIALVGVTIECGWPSLSNPAVYPPEGQAMLRASGPGLLGLLVLAGVAIWRWDCSDGALLRAALVPWALITLAALVLCRAPDALLFATPPLMPSSTGLVSMLLVQGRAACFLLALLLALRACRQLWLRRRKAPAPAPSAAPSPGPRVPA